MELRLQKVLAQAGVASRRKAEELITAGRIEVNGKIVREMGLKVDPQSDIVKVDGRVLGEREQKCYFVLYKPTGMVTTLSDPQGRPTIKDCIGTIRERVFAVGRLDWDAEGALIITNDGELANRLMHPRYQVPRTYLAKVKGEPDAATLQKLRDGVRLEDGFIKPEQVELEKEAEKNTWIRLVVAEGRPHLVKRLCAAIGHPVVRLFRPQYAGIGVAGLRPGKWRALEPEEIESLKHAGPDLPAQEGPFKMPARRHRQSEPRQERPTQSERPARHGKSEPRQDRPSRSERPAWQGKSEPRQDRSSRSERPAWQGKSEPRQDRPSHSERPARHGKSEPRQDRPSQPQRPTRPRGDRPGPRRRRP
ncbi:MAG TPA: pseudouridine synthase [Myxococcales bacterium]